MSDDLVERLRSGLSDFDDWDAAADRIEELEAKLAKAVDGLRDAAEAMDGYVGKGYGDPYRELTEKLTNTEKGQ